MASKQGQILYLGGSSGTQGGAGGSLSTRFQKLSQSRNSGVTIVNPTTGATTAEGGRGGGGGGIDTRLGRSLGLGFGTGSHPPGSGGHRISTASARGGLSTGRGNRSGLVSGGLHTPGGLARAMQERGTGVSDAFLLAPAAIAAGGGGVGGGRRRDRKQINAVAAGGAVGGTRASRHKALVLGGRPGRRQQNAAAAVPTPQQQRQRGAPQANGAAGGKSTAAKAAKAAAKAVGGAAGAQGAKAGDGKKGKKGGKAAKPAPVNAGDLDSQLDEYMMKDGRTATSMLDNDLDSYMADKPADW